MNLPRIMASVTSHDRLGYFNGSFVGGTAVDGPSLVEASAFRRSWSGCVMRDVCHCTAPIAALNISTFGKVGGSATSRQVFGLAASRVGSSRRTMKGRITRRHAVDVDAGLWPP